MRFSQQSLENLCITISNLKDDHDLKVAVFPEDILQNWVLEQIPDKEFIGVVRLYLTPEKDSSLCEECGEDIHSTPCTIILKTRNANNE